MLFVAAFAVLGWLLVVPVGAVGSFWPGVVFSGLCVCVCVWACRLCPKLRARCGCTPRLLRFILLVSFSDALLVVSILDKVYDCHL